MSVEAAPPTEGDIMSWNKELMDIQREQHMGTWDFKGNENDEKAKEAHDVYVLSRVRRGIELTALLRRSNTGPAKATGTRASKARKGTKSQDELKAIEDELLS